MGTSIATANITPRVVVTSDFVEISGFKERDPDVVRVVLESGRPELAVHNLLVIGAHATMGASMQLDAHIVEERFEQMTGDFDTRMQAAATTIRDATEQFLDADEGALPQVLSELKNDIAVILGNTFDEDSKSSVIAKIEGVLLATTEQLDRKVREALDPDSPDSPLARTKNDVLCAVKEQAATVLREVRDVALMVAGNTAKADLFEKTAGKGLAFEAMIEVAIAPVAAIHCDAIERVGTQTGASGTKKGDLLVSLSTDDTSGEEVKFVLETKDRSLSMTKTLAELDKALANHGASAAVAVFSHQGLAPTSVPFWWSGNHAVLVYDKDDPDPRCLQLAYAWARWIARREMIISDEGELDVAGIEAALSRARQALARHQTIKACHSAAKKRIEEASLHVADVFSGIDDALREVWDLLRS